MVPCKSTAEEVSFEWSQHGVTSTASKLKQVFIINSESDWVSNLHVIGVLS